MSAFDRWSNSSLSTLQMCGWKFYLRHIKKDRRPSGLGAKRGIAVHRVAAEIHKLQMKLKGKWQGPVPQAVETPGSPESVAEARDIAAGAFERAYREGVLFTKEETKLGIKLAKADAKDAAIDLSGMYAKDVAPNIVPLAVEREVTIAPKDVAIKVLGKMDLVEEDDGEVIRDKKTAEKAPWEHAAEVSQQLTMYHLIRLADTGAMPRAGRLVHLVRTPKRHEMKAYIQETTRTADDVNRLINRINTAVEAVEKGIFVPADEAAPGSPCSWCEYADGTCKYVRRRE
jgi:hypothetical protein